jgi:hypothetical protein
MDDMPDKEHTVRQASLHRLAAGHQAKGNGMAAVIVDAWIAIDTAKAK